MTRAIRPHRTGATRRTLLGVLILGVAILAVPLCLEFRARSGFAESLKRLEAALHEGGQENNLTLPGAEELVSGNPQRYSRVIGGQRWEIFKWSGVTDRYLVALRLASSGVSVEVVETWDHLPENSPDPSAEQSATKKLKLASEQSSEITKAASKPQPNNQPMPRKMPPSHSTPTSRGPRRAPVAANPQKRPTNTILAPKADAWHVNPKITEKVRSLNESLPETTELLDQVPKAQESAGQRWLKWHRLTHTEAYRQFGSHSPKWDEDVTHFLESFIQRDINNALVAPELLTLGYRVEAAGCRDPLVLSVQSHLASQVGHRQEALRLVRECESMDDSQYPPRWQFTTRLRSLRVLQKLEDKTLAELRQKTVRRTIDCVIKIASDDSLDDNARRRHFLEMSGLFSGLLNKQQLEQLGTALQGLSQGDRWLNRMILASLHRQLGWITWGSGRLKIIGPKAPQPFKAQMWTARALLLEAWDMNPSLPEAAMELIEVTLAAGGIANEPPRFWFHQAVMADYEEPQTYNRYRMTLQSKWGGDIAVMLKFGRACLNGGQFQTNVPWQFHQSVLAALADSRFPQAILQAPELFEDYKRLFEGYAKHDGPKRQSFRDSQLAAIAVRCGHLREAEEILAKLADQADPEAFADLGVSLTAVQEHLESKAKEAQPFRGHQGELNGVAVVKDGFLVTANSDGSAKVWDLQTQSEIGSLTDHLDSLTTIAVSRNRELVASGDGKGRVIVWKPEFQQEFHTLQIVPPVRVIAFSKDDRFIATGGGDGHIRVWDLDDGRLAATLPASGRQIGSLSFSGDGRFLASTAVPNSFLANGNHWDTEFDTRSVTLWELKSLEPQSWRVFSAGANLSEFSNNGRTLVTAGWDTSRAESSIKLVDVKTGNTTWTCSLSCGRLYQLLFSPDDRRLYAAAANGDVLVVDVKNGELLARFRGHKTEVRSIALTPDGTELISGDMSGVIHQWDVSLETIASQTMTPLMDHEFRDLVREGLRHGKNDLATWENGGVTFWDSRTNYRESGGWEGIPSGAQLMAFDMSPDADLIAIVLAGAPNPPEVQILSSQSKHRIAQFPLVKGEGVSQVRLLPGGQTVALNELGKGISIWSFAGTTPRQVRFLPASSEPFSSFDVTDDGQYLVAGTSRGQLQRWNLERAGSTKASPEELAASSELWREGIVDVQAVSGSLFIASSTDSVIELWNSQSKERVALFPGAIVSASPDGRWIATAGGTQLQNEARMYDVSTGKLVRRFRGGHAGEILSMAWSPDGLFLFTASTNGKVRRWNTQNGHAELTRAVDRQQK